MAKKGAAATLWRRSTITMLIIILLGFGTIIARLFYLQVYQSEELQKRAVEQQLHDTTVSGKRGSIYDSNGNILAQSITVWDIVLAPANFKNWDDEKRESFAQGLSKIIDLDKDDIIKKTKENSYYVMLERGADAELRDKVLEFCDKMYEEHEISGVINFIENYKRYYTNDNFAGSILGFVGSDSQGLSGLEYEYDEELNGNSGRIVIAQDAQNNPLPYQYEQKVEASDGNDLVLTIDENIQSIMEKYVRQTIKEYNVANRGCAIMMNVKTGAILGFACEGSFDPNNPFEITDKNKQKEIEKLPESEQDAAIAKAQHAQWRNKGVSDTYVPGSVFKMVTASAVLSEGLIKEDTTFTCTGSYVPYEGAESIDCWTTSGHGTQHIEDALCNSCNPAFMQMGFMLGREKFYEYYVALGFSERTGIDLPGESESIFYNKEGEPAGMSLMDLAVSSFGQNFKITPIQMITACSAIANGGKLMQPYVVSQIVDSDGNVVRSAEPTVKRQAISEEVADKVVSMLERNAKPGGGAANGYVAGYRIGGKTGTSQKIVDEDGNPTNDYIASFCGIAPCDDPEIALLCYFDTPDPEINYYGSAVAGPCFRNIMREVLPYLGVERVYTDEEAEQLDTTVGVYDDMSLDEAKNKVENDGLRAEVVGNGNTVIAQNPSAYSSIPKEGTVVLYTDEQSQKKKVKVPDFRNCSLSDVNYLAATNDLNVCLSGSAINNSQAYAKSQDIEPGTEVEPYTVITVEFNEDNGIE